MRGGHDRPGPVQRPPAISLRRRIYALILGLFGCAGFRLAIYALLLAISATALALFLWWATAGLLDRQTEAAINADAQGLSERWAEGGLSALIVTIEDRLAQNIDDDAIYFLADRSCIAWPATWSAGRPRSPRPVRCMSFR